MFFDTPVVPNNVQHFTRPPTYNFADLQPSERQTFWLVPTSLALQIATLAVIGPLPKTSPIRTFLPAIICPILLGLCIQAVLYSHHLTSPVINFAYGTAAICCTLQGLDLLFVIPYRYEMPVTEIIKISDKPCPSVRSGLSGPTWSQRLDWASACYNNPRMLATPFEPSILKSRRKRLEGSSRSAFLGYRIGRLMAIWVLMDILLAYVRYDVWFASFAHDSCGVPTIPLRVVRTVGGASAIWMAVDGLHTIASLIIVGLGGDDYRQWPDMFGLWTEEWYTIAEFWGIAWHGLFRQQFVFLTYTVKSVVLRLFIPFLFSAILHLSGAYMQSRAGMGALRFFLIQPVGILVQQLSLWTLGSSNTAIKNEWKKWIVLMSTLTWLIVTGEDFIRQYAEGGMYDIEPLPISWLSLLGLVEGKAWRWDGFFAHFGWY